MPSSVSRSSIVAWSIWAVVSIFYAYQYILRVMPSLMLNDMMHQFGVNAATFSQFSGVYYIGYSLMHLPLGIFLDRYGPKKIMPICILFMILGQMPLLFSTHWIYPIIGRCLVGMGSSAAILSVFKVIRMIFNEKKFARMLSFSVAIGLIGAIYGGGPVSYLQKMWGWQPVIQFSAVLGLLLAAIAYTIVPDIKTERTSTILSDIKEVFSNHLVIWTCLFAGLMVGPLEGFADAWGAVFLKEVYGFEKTVAAALPSLIFIGMCYGSPILSFIADKGGGYLPTIIGSGLAMAICFSLLLLHPLNPAFLSLAFVIIGICSAYQILAIYKASTYVRKEVAGLTTAVANMIIMVFGYAFHTIIGNVINSLGGPDLPYALRYGIAVIPVALYLGATGFVFLLRKEKGVL